MTLTLELSDETAARAQKIAWERGLDLNAFFATAVEEAFIAENDEPDWEVVAAGREAVEDSRAGRLLTLEEVDGHVEAALAAVRERRAAVSSALGSAAP